MYNYKNIGSWPFLGQACVYKKTFWKKIPMYDLGCCWFLLDEIYFENQNFVKHEIIFEYASAKYISNGLLAKYFSNKKYPSVPRMVVSASFSTLKLCFITDNVYQIVC